MTSIPVTMLIWPSILVLVCSTSLLIGVELIVDMRRIPLTLDITATAVSKGASPSSSTLSSDITDNGVTRLMFALFPLMVRPDKISLSDAINTSFPDAAPLRVKIRSFGAIIANDRRRRFFSSRNVISVIRPFCPRIIKTSCVITSLPTLP